MEYKAIVTYTKKVVISGNSKSKAEFANDLRRRGYKVDPRYVKEAQEFDYIVQNTKGTEEDWKKGKPKIYNEYVKHYRCVARHKTNKNASLIKDGLFRSEKDFIDFLHSEGYVVSIHTVKLAPIFDYIMNNTPAKRGDWDKNYDNILLEGKK